jgi:hypothetical protein
MGKHLCFWVQTKGHMLLSSANIVIMFPKFSLLALCIMIHFDRDWVTRSFFNSQIISFKYMCSKLRFSAFWFLVSGQCQTRHVLLCLQLHASVQSISLPFNFLEGQMCIRCDFYISFQLTILSAFFYRWHLPLLYILSEHESCTFYFFFIKLNHTGCIYFF